MDSASESEAPSHHCQAQAGTPAAEYGSRRASARPHDDARSRPAGGPDSICPASQAHHDHTQVSIPSPTRTRTTSTSLVRAGAGRPYRTARPGGRSRAVAAESFSSFSLPRSSRYHQRQCLATPLAVPTVCCHPPGRWRTSEPGPPGRPQHAQLLAWAGSVARSLCGPEPEGGHRMNPARTQ